MDILGKLSDGRVVSFEINETKTLIRATEMCDLYFSIDLSKSEVKQLIEELATIHDSMCDILNKG